MQRRSSILFLLREEIIVLLVAIVVLVVTGLAYAANGSPAHPNAAASNGGDPKGDHQGMDDILLVDGVDGLVGRWLDAEDPGEPPD
jgi:hypothetical protein